MKKRMAVAPVACLALVLGGAASAVADSAFEVSGTQYITSFTNAKAADGLVTHHTQKTFGPMEIDGLGAQEVGTFEVLTRVLDLDEAGNVLGGSVTGSWVIDLKPFDLGKCRGGFFGSITEGFAGVVQGQAHCPDGESLHLTFTFGPGDMQYEVTGSLVTP
jgi:hypothetical protein